MSLLVKMVSSYPRAIKKSMKFVRQILTAVYDIFSVYDPGIQMSLTCQKIRQIASYKSTPAIQIVKKLLI